MYQESIVLLRCSILIAIDETEEIFSTLELYCEREPTNPKALRLFLDYQLFYYGGIRDLNKATTRMLPDWISLTERLLKIDPTCDYALSLMIKFHECHEDGLFQSALI
jgi:hypothetical protein